MGTIWVSAAILGGLFGAVFTDYTGWYKTMMIVATSWTFIFIIGFSLTMTFWSSQYPLLCALMGLIGLGAAAVPPILEVLFPNFISPFFYSLTLLGDHRNNLSRSRSDCNGHSLLGS